MKRLVPLVLWSLLAGACAAPEPDVCELATEHVAACVEESLPASTASCTGETETLARQILATPCAELSAHDADGKSDALEHGGTLALCVGLTVPLLITGEDEGALCCFDYNCEGSLVCRSATCHPKSARGGVCDRRNHCQAGLACVDDRCEAPRTEGQRCDATDACAIGFICQDGKCAPPAAAGEICERALDCDSARCHEGRCANEVGRGATCDAQNVCRIGLACTDGTCQKRPASGGTCYRDQLVDCGANETCWEGWCEPRRDEGGECASMFDCKFGLFCRDATCQP